MDDNRDAMTESPVYYTTSYEIRIAKTLCAFIAANGIILFSFTLNRLQAAGLGVVHGYIMGMILSYRIFGIMCKKRNRRIILALGCGMLGFLAALDWRFETVFILFCSLLTVAAALWCLHRDQGKVDGDYAAFLEDDFDHTWFDVVTGQPHYNCLQGAKRHKKGQKQNEGRSWSSPKVAKVKRNMQKCRLHDGKPGNTPL